MWALARLAPPDALRSNQGVITGAAKNPQLSGKIELERPDHRSVVASRTVRILVVAPGETAAVVHGALTAIAANDRNCFDELHGLTAAAAADRLSAVLLKPGAASALADRCRRLGVPKADIMFGRRTIHTLGASGVPDSIADDALNILRNLCGDTRNEVTVVVRDRSSWCRRVASRCTRASAGDV
jgi:hypothetical protein